MLFIPALLGLIAIGIHLVLGGEVPQTPLLGGGITLAQIGLLLIMFLLPLTGNISEFGFRGYALPIVSHITEASKERPYLSFRMPLDPVLVGSVMTELGHSAGPKAASVKAFNVSALDAGLLDAVVRLVRLIDSPTEARVLAPLVKREIICRLLLGEQGDRLRHIAFMGGYTSPIA